MIGTASADTVTVKLYDSNACTTQIGTGTRASFVGVGITATATANDTTTIYATSSDAAGNTSACTSMVSYVHDNAAPADPTYTSIAPTSPGSNSTPAVVGGASADSVTVKLYDGNTCATQIGTGTKAAFEGSGIAATVSTNATTTIYAKAFDAVGNGSGCISMTSYLHDNLAPTASQSGAPSGSSSATTLAITVAGTGVVTYRYKVDEASATDCAVSSSYTNAVAVGTPITDSISGLGNVLLRLCIVGIDAAGNQQAYASATTTTWTKAAPVAPDAVQAFTATPGDNLIDLAWTAPSSSLPDGYVVVYSPYTAVAFTPTDGVALTAGSSVGSGSFIAYVGTGTSYSHTDLAKNMKNYYKVYGYKNGTYVYSAAVSANATANGTGYRYLRLVFHQIDDSYGRNCTAVGVREIDFTVGGSPVANTKSANAGASGAIGAYAAVITGSSGTADAWKAFDGSTNNTTSIWWSGTGTFVGGNTSPNVSTANTWLQVDFGSGSKFLPSQIKVTGEYNACDPQHISTLASNDGVVWLALGNLTLIDVLTWNGSNLTSTFYDADGFPGVWADKVDSVTSQYSSSAKRIRGAPDCGSFSDCITAWAPGSANSVSPVVNPSDARLQTITVGFNATDSCSYGSTFREAYGSGSVTMVEGSPTTSGTSDFTTLWSGVDSSTPGALADFKVTWATTLVPTKRLRVTIDTDTTNSWEELDSIKLMVAPCP